MKLITAIYLLLPLLMLCPIGSIALKCHFCEGADANKDSDCPEGQPTEVKECIIPPNSISSDYWCRLSLQKQNGPRLSLGCGHFGSSTPLLRTNTYCSEGAALSGGSYFGCNCATDACNSFTSGSLTCLQCKNRKNLCSDGETPSEERCNLNTKYCVYRHRYRQFEDGKSKTEVWRGCSTEFRDKLEYKDTGNGYSCSDTYNGLNHDRECYCTSKVCNTYLNKVNPPKTESGGERTRSSSLTFSIIISILAIAFPSNP